MAEAAVAEPLPTRFYCHVCNVEINIPNTDFTCPLCSGGFVEELPPNAPAGSPMVVSNAGPLADRDDPFRISDLRNEIATLLMSRNGGDPFNMTHVSGPQFFLGLDDHPSGSQHSHQSGGNTATAGGQTTPAGAAAHSRPIVQIRQPTIGGLDTFLMDFLQSLTTGGGIPMVSTSRDGSNQPSTFWMGNLGDYAWGREGIDTIVTQLLNQMETSGPPPLARDKIDAIPKVEVAEEDVQRKLQCSVCWEDFKLSELVRKLPCSHIYHENCIVPWLDLHGTCPICRKSLSDEEEAMNAEDAVAGSDSNMEMNDLNHPCPHFRRRNAPANPSTATSTATTATNTERRPAEPATNQAQRSDEQSQQQQQQQQSTTRNNVFTFDDSNMDLD